jgi:hypothetical protein
MPRYNDDFDRYGGGDVNSPIEIGNLDLPVTIAPDPGDDQASVSVTADQNNYGLPPSGFVIVSTDASRNFTGFTGARLGLTVFCNGGSFDAVIVNNSGSSTLQNRTLTHTGANITLNPGESALLFYDFVALRWRTIGFV